MPIREATPDDAGAVLVLLERLFGETNRLLYEPGELALTPEQYACRMAAGIARGTFFMNVATQNSTLVGICYGSLGHVRRNRHVLSFGLGVLRTHWRHGIGAELVQSAQHWARARGASRLELRVQADDERARRLYRRLGFVDEGLARDALRIDGRYVDEVVMAMHLEAREA